MNISSATIASQAVPIASRTQVSMHGSTDGNRIFLIIFHSNRLNTRATFM